MSKLIILTYDFPPRDGGIARLCQEISTGMLKYYDKVEVLTRKSDDISVTYNYTSVKRIEFSKNRIRCEKEILSYLSKIKDKDNYTVLCGLWHPEAMLAIVAGFKNVYVLGHGTEFLSGTSIFRNKVWLPYYAAHVLKATKGVICNSRYTECLVKKNQPQANTFALPLGVNHNFFKPTETKCISDNGFLQIASVSRIEKFKGHDFIAKVIALLPENIRTKIKWNIAGKGPDILYLKKVIEELGLNEIVTFHGFVRDEDLPEFYNMNDLFILCSREFKEVTTVEGFGLVFLEAQSCGIPVIGTNSGGISDAIENQNGGWLIEQDNQEELQSLLIKIFHDRVFLKNQGEKARRRVEQFCTWEMYNRKLYNILNSNDE